MDRPFSLNYSNRFPDLKKKNIYTRWRKEKEVYDPSTKLVSVYFIDPYNI